MALSIDEYRKMKSENKFFWDTDSLKQTQNDINDYLRGVGNQANGAEMWSDDEFNNQRSQISGLRGRLNALQAYANSVKDQDKSAYDGLMQAHSSLKNGLNEAEKWFNGNTAEVRKQQKLYKAVEAMQGFRSTAAEQAAKYGLDEKEIQDAYDKKRQYEQELNTYKAVEAMKKGSTTAAEQAAKYGLNIEKTQEAYDNNSKYLRAELQKDKYDSLSYDELYNLVTDPKSYAEKISGQVADFYLGEKEAYNEIAKWYNITPEQVREFNEGSKEAHTAAGYASAALSDEDRKYVIQRMLETGTAEQLEQLKNDNKVINKMFKDIPELNQAIEDKKEEEYYLSVLEKFPNAEKVINNHYGWESMNQKSPDSVTYREDMQPDISSNEEFEANKREYQKLVDAGVDTARFHKFEKRYKEHQEALKKNEEWAQLAEEHAVGASLLSIPMNMIGSVGDVINYAEASRNDGYVDTAGTMNRQAQTIRDTVNKKINNPVGQFFYSTVMSVGDMALAAAVDRIMPGAMGAVMSGGMFFSSAGVNAANEVIDSGGNYDQAAWTLVAQGAAEVVFEEISLDKIVKLKANENIEGIKDVVINALKQMGIESSEEVATSIANAITDGITNKDLSEFERNKRAYIDSGMSDDEAHGAAVRDFFGGLLTDALGGAVSGGVMGGGASTYAAVRNNIAMNNMPVSLGGVELTAKQAKKLAPEYYHELAQELTQSKDFDVNTLIEQAKQGGEKSQKLAAAMEKTVAEKGKDAITSADVENVLISLYGDNIKARQTGENIESAAAIESIDKAANQSRAESFFEQNLSEYDETGAKKTEGGNTDVKTTRAFGASHPNGLYATDSNKNKVIITAVESSQKEYGGDDRSVILRTNDGKTVNANEVEFDDPDIQRLVNLAPNYDTLGARALLANFEAAKARGLSVDAYIQQSEALYKIGRSGVTFENAVKSPEFSGIIKSMGENAAKSFLNAGNNDTEAHVKFNDINLRRVRVPGAKTSARSRVWAESSVEINASPEFMSVMQAIAEVVSKDGKVGRDIVFTDRLSGEDAGVYSNGKIYISAESDEHVMITTALHEAVHKAKVYAPAEYRALEKFVMNYLVANGQDVKTLLDNIAAIWGQDAADAETQREELIAQTVAALASDENAFMKAVQIKENKSLLDKVREALKTIIEHVKKFFRDVDAQGRKYGHNIQAQPWLDDLKALEGLAEKFSEMMTAVRENESRVGVVESAEKYSIKRTRHMDYLKQIEQVESRTLNGSNAIYIGKVNSNVANMLGLSNEIAIKQADYRKSRREKGKNVHYSSHNVPKDFFVQVQQRIESAPLAVDNGEKLTLITDYPQKDKNGKNSYVILGIAKNQKMENDTVDLIKSAYPLDDIEKRIIDYDKKGSLIVIDKKRAEILLATIGITPSQLSSFLNSDDTIPQSSPKINTQSNIQGKKSKNDAFYFDDVESLKERQNSIVQQNNSMHDDYHTGIRGVEDIYTFEEALGNGEYEEGEDFSPDYTWRMAQRAVSSGKITVYSSYPIKQGVFVTPSKMEAEGYSGSGRTYKKTVALTDVAWIDPIEGQYANVSESGDDMFKGGRKAKNDAFYFDDEDFDNDSEYIDYEDKPIDTKELLKFNTPDEVIYALYSDMGNISGSIIKDSPGIKLEKEDRINIARRIMKSYEIARKTNPGLDEKIAERIDSFVKGIENQPDSAYSTHFNALAADCKSYLEKSGKYERGFMQKTSEKVRAVLRGKTLVMPKNAANYVLDDYGGDIANVRKAYGGLVNVVLEENKGDTKGVIYMEELMNKLAEIQEIRELFEDGVMPGEYTGWEFLDDLLNSALSPKFVNPFYNNVYENMNDSAVEMAAAIVTAIVDEKAGKGVTVRANPQETLQALINIRKTLIAKTNALHEVKYEKYRTMKKINNYYVSFASTNFRREYQERTMKTQYLRRLGKKLDSLTKRLDGKANRNEYIPEKLKKPILNVLQMFKTDPGETKNGKSKDMPMYFGAFHDLGAVSDRVNALALAYEKLKGKKNFGKGDYLSYDINGLAFDEDVLQDLKKLGELIKGKNVYQMKAAELGKVIEVMDSLDLQLKKAVEIIVNGKKAFILDVAGDGVSETRKVHFSKDSKIFVTEKLKDARNRFLATSLDPVRYGRMLSGYKDDGKIYLLLRDLHSGEQKAIRISQSAFTPVQEVFSRYSRKDLSNLQRKAVDGFVFTDLDSGENVKVSQDMLLQIYLTDLQADGHRHLYHNEYNPSENKQDERKSHYTRVADLDYLNKNRVLPDISGNRQKAKGEKSHKIKLSITDLAEIHAYIENTPLLKELAKTIHDVLNGTLADEINRVSMQHSGKMIATVKDYFPIRVDSYDPHKTFDINTEGEGIFTDERLKSRSFTKRRTQRSHNAIIIEGALSVFQRHVNETSEYCGMMIPVDNLKKVLNSGDGEILLLETLEQKFGGNVKHYLNKLLGDIQKRKDNTDENILTRATGHAMGAALFLNVRSALKNWGALPLANKYFGTGNVAKATVMGLAKGKELVAKYNDYTPYMWYREQGNGTVVGELSRQHGLYGKWTDKFDLMSKADRAVVNSLLYAAEQHVKQTTNLKPDSEEFKREVAKQFETCVDESQPNSMITSKPQFVRNDIMRVLSLNAFASQRMAMGNGIIDSYMEYSVRRHENRVLKSAESKAASKAALKKFVRTLIGVVESGMLQSALGLLANVLIYHKWDDLKDEEGNITPESAFGGLLKKWASGIPEEIAGSFVWLDKIYGVAEKLIDEDAYGADLGVMSFETVTDISNAVQKGNWLKAWNKTADLLGVPAALGSNVQRLLQSGWSYGQDIVNGWLGFTDNTGSIDMSYMDVQIAAAYENGDGETAKWLSAIWEKSGKSEQARSNNLAEALSIRNEDIIQAAIDKENGNLTAHKKTRDKYLNTGLDGGVFDSAGRKVISSIKKDVSDQKFDNVSDAAEYLVEQGFNETAALRIAESVLIKSDSPEKSEYSYKEAFRALAEGDEESYKAARNAIAATMVKNGQAETEEAALAAVDKKMKSITYTKSLFDDYHSVSGEKFYRAKEQLERIYGKDLEKKYKEYLKKYVNK